MKKPFFKTLSGCSHFKPFSSQEVFFDPSEDDFFFLLKRSYEVQKYLSFYTDFKNLHLISVKSAPKKVMPKKRFVGGKI